ncbi:MAG: MFS transporter [Thiotrichales bacterium]|nr:MFS transporter [Thiotrichales bacterium]
MMASNKAVLKIDVAYGLMALPLALLGVPLYLYLPSYLFDNWQVSLTVIGGVLMLARLLDVVTDPLIGYWSDRLSVRISRFSFILAGACLIVVGVLALFVPHVLWLQFYPVLYLFGASMVAFLGWTLIAVPYQAMVAELVQDTHLKTRLTSIREGFVVVGVVLALASPYLLGMSPTSPELFEWLWLGLFGLILIALTAMKIWVTPQLQTPKPHALNMMALWQNLWHEHRWSLQLMPAYFLNNLANAFPATLFLLFVTHALNLKAQAGFFLMVYFLCGILALPLWFMLTRRIGKLAAWRVSIVLSMVGFVGVFWLDSGDFNGYLLICILTGFSLGADMAIPASMQADIAQKLSLEVSNINGLLFGIWGLLTKFALALAVGVALPILDWLGLSQGTLEATKGLWWLYAAVPLVLKLVALGMLWRLKAIKSPMDFD